MLSNVEGMAQASTKKLIVFCVLSNPEPDEIVLQYDGDRAIVTPDTHDQ